MANIKRVSELTPEEMARELRRFVIGQDDAISALCNAYWRNTRRRLSKEKGYAPNKYLPKANVLFAAPSGSGKTYLITKFAEIFGVPFIKCDLTSLSAEGYVGAKPRNIIQALLQKVDGNASLAQRAIIHLDEVDKIKANGRIGDVGGEAVQEMLLTWLEGADILLDVGHNRVKSFTPADITFVATGAFEGMKRRDGDTWISEQDLIGYGISRQFLARFSIRAWMNELGEEQMRRILLESEDSPIKQLTSSFRDWAGVDLQIESGAIDAIVKLALEKRIGARALHDVVQTHLGHVSEMLPGRANGVRGYLIETQTVLNRRPPRTVKGKSDYVPLELCEDEEVLSAPETELSAPKSRPTTIQPKMPPAETPNAKPAATPEPAKGLRPPVPAPPVPPKRRRFALAIGVAALLLGIVIYLSSTGKRPEGGQPTKGLPGLKTPRLFEEHKDRRNHRQSSFGPQQSSLT